MEKLLKLLLPLGKIARYILKSLRLKYAVLVVILYFLIILRKKSHNRSSIKVKKETFTKLNVSTYSKELIELHKTIKTKSITSTTEIFPIHNKKDEYLQDDCSLYPSELIGNITVNVTIKPSFKEIEEVAGPDLIFGGCHKPSCKALQKVAILIPFKDRDSHLKTLLYYLHPMLMRQKSYYCVFVVEQFDFGQFNKAMIMNAGFKEVLKLDSFDCIIFHDVDMLAENDKNFYGCGPQPRHLSPAIDKFGYAQDYGTKFGGVTAITPKQYQKANGHSNKFWGWGGEDNDMEYRIANKNMTIEVSEIDVGRYKMIPHRVSWQFKENARRFSLKKDEKTRADTDGLLDLIYTLVGRKYFPTYTKIIVDIRAMDIRRISLLIDGVQEMDVELTTGKCRWDVYTNKYLDHNIPTFSNIVEMLPKLKSGETEEIPPPPIEKKTDSNQKPKAQILQSEKTHTVFISNFEDAKIICNALSPECRGIVHERNLKRFLLRKSGLPRHFDIELTSRSRNNTSQIFQTSSFVKYCPGVLGYTQKYNKTIPIFVNDSLESKRSHTYRFEVEFSVLNLIDPVLELIFRGTPLFEAKHIFPKDISTMTATKTKNNHNFKGSKDKIFTFTTKDFDFPTLPGCFHMKSEIIDKNYFPIYEWNWWFESSTNDKKKDFKLRDVFMEEKRQEQLAKEKKWFQYQKLLLQQLKKKKHIKIDSKT